MGVSAPSVSGSPAAPRRPWTARLLPLLLGLILLLAPAPASARADVGGLGWSLRDQDGHRWSLRIFPQPDPAFPGGDRLRLSALNPGVAVDHDRPLRISDGAGGSWALTNRSQELVPPDRSELPQGSAQFDLAALRPRPSDALPLQLRLPLAGEGQALLVLGPEQTRALHGLAGAGAADQDAVPVSPRPPAG